MFEKITENFEKCILHRGFGFIFIKAAFLMGLRNTVKRWGFSLLAQDSPIAAQNSLSWFFPAGNLDGDSVPHSHGTHKILDFGYPAPHECVRSRTPTAYRELLCNYKMQEDYAMALSLIHILQSSSPLLAILPGRISSTHFLVGSLLPVQNLRSIHGQAIL